METLKIADKTFTSRLFTGTGKFSFQSVMEEAIIASESQLVTVAMKRIRMEDKNDDMLKHILRPGVQLLPNTSGVRDAKEAIFAAQLSREAFRYQLAETGNSSRSPLSAARSGRNPESHRRTG